MDRRREDYVKQALPPWIVDFAYPAESLVAEMDYAGVDRALLHRTPYMGLSNEYIAACVRRYPQRIQGLAYVEEWKIESETDACIRKLERAVRELGLAGLQFMAFHRPLYGQPASWEGGGFEPYWEAVEALEIPVFFTIGSGASPEAYLDELRALRRWMERYPEVRVVLTHGFPWRLFSDEEKLEVPDAVYETVPLDHPSFHIQILFAVFLQSRWDYPMPQMRPTLETMVERIGPERIMWGTDIPIVLLHWTYRQSLDYIRRYCEFIGAARHGSHPRGKYGPLHGARAERRRRAGRVRSIGVGVPDLLRPVLPHVIGQGSLHLLVQVLLEVVVEHRQADPARAVVARPVSEAVVPEHDVTGLAVDFDAGETVVEGQVLLQIRRGAVAVAAVIVEVEAPVAAGPDLETAAQGWNGVDIANHSEVKWVAVEVAGAGAVRSVALRQVAVDAAHAIGPLQVPLPKRRSAALQRPGSVASSRTIQSSVPIWRYFQ